MEKVEPYKVDQPVVRGQSYQNGSDEPGEVELVGPLDLLDNDLDLNLNEKEKEKEKRWVEKMNQLNTERSREDQTKMEHSKDDLADSPEFSPIVYWREPLPEVLPLLDLEEKPEKIHIGQMRIFDKVTIHRPGIF